MTTSENAEKVVVELSENELRMIELKRKEEALEEEKKAIEKAKNDEQKIIDIKAEIVKFSEAELKRKTFVTELFVTFEKQFPGLYELIINQGTKQFQAYNYLPVGRDVLYDKDVKYDSAIIRRCFPNDKYLVYAKEHIVYSMRSYGGNNKGLRAFIEGVDYKAENRAYKNAKSIHKIIQVKIDEKESNNKSKRERIELNEEAVVVFQKLFPVTDDGDILSVKHEESWYGDSYTRTGHMIDRIEVKFKSGLKVTYRYYMNKEEEATEETFKYRISDIYISELDQEAVIEALRKFPAEKQS